MNRLQSFATSYNDSSSDLTDQLTASTRKMQKETIEIVNRLTLPSREIQKGITAMMKPLTDMAKQAGALNDQLTDGYKHMIKPTNLLQSLYTPPGQLEIGALGLRNSLQPEIGALGPRNSLQDPLANLLTGARAFNRLMAPDSWFKHPI